MPGYSITTQLPATGCPRLRRAPDQRPAMARRVGWERLRRPLACIRQTAARHTRITTWLAIASVAVALAATPAQAQYPPTQYSQAQYSPVHSPSTQGQYGAIPSTVSQPPSLQRSPQAPVSQTAATVNRSNSSTAGHTETVQQRPFYTVATAHPSDALGGPSDVPGGKRGAEETAGRNGPVIYPLHGNDQSMVAQASGIQLRSINQQRYYEEQQSLLAARYHDDRVDHARRVAQQYRAAAYQLGPLANLATETAEFVDAWADLAVSYQGLAGRIYDADLTLATTQREYNDVRQRLDDYGLSPTVGLLLQNKKEQLYRLKLTDQASRLAADEIARTRENQAKLEMVSVNGADPNLQASGLLSSLGQPIRIEAESQLLPLLVEHLKQRHQWLETLRLGYQDYQQTLSQLDSTLSAHSRLTDDYRRLIDRKIIWIRSGRTMTLADGWKLDDGLESLFAVQRSGQLGDALRKKWDANPIRGIGLLMTIAALLLVRWYARHWIVAVGARKRMRDASRDRRKVVASLLTPIAAAALPAALYVTARWLCSDVVYEPTLQVGKAFYATALIALTVGLPQQLLTNFGLIDRHTDIEMPRRARASAYLGVVGVGLSIAAYLVVMLSQIDHGVWRESAARVLYLLALALAAWTFHLALRPRGGAILPLIGAIGGGLIDRLRWVIYLAAVGFPLAMMLLIVLGYPFTANQLILRAAVSLSGLTILATWWPGLTILAGHLWLQLTGTAVPPAEPSPYRSFDDEPPAPKQVVGVLVEQNLELKHQLAFLFQCGLTLVVLASLGWLWIDAFPNLRLGNPVVWTVNHEVFSTTLGPAGEEIQQASWQQTPITALHLIAAAATLFVAFQLAKLLPGLFDALVLQRVSFDEGMEHLLLVIGRTVLFGAGCLLACQWIGLQWQTIQWLAVGLAIGLGFGLQDMVRNLYGGLVVLFEKPARLGDLITVGRVTGRVAAQKLRTTTIADHDGREVIVPNQAFVSEDVTNWMGAGRLKTVALEVAVNRQERPADVCRMIQQLVIEQSGVLLSPAPQATLVCVAKNSQRIEVVAWIEDHQNASRFRDDLLRTVSMFLREKGLMVAGQPKQPELRETYQVESERLFGKPAKSNRRSA